MQLVKPTYVINIFIWQRMKYEKYRSTSQFFASLFLPHVWLLLDSFRPTQTVCARARVCVACTKCCYFFGDLSKLLVVLCVPSAPYLNLSIEQYAMKDGVMYACFCSPDHEIYELNANREK